LSTRRAGNRQSLRPTPGILSREVPSSEERRAWPLLPLLRDRPGFLRHQDSLGFQWFEIRVLSANEAQLAARHRQWVVAEGSRRIARTRRRSKAALAGKGAAVHRT